MLFVVVSYVLEGVIKLGQEATDHAADGNRQTHEGSVPPFASKGAGERELCSPSTAFREVAEGLLSVVTSNPSLLIPVT